MIASPIGLCSALLAAEIIVGPSGPTLGPSSCLRPAHLNVQISMVKRSDNQEHHTFPFLKSSEKWQYYQDHCNQLSKTPRVKIIRRRINETTVRNQLRTRRYSYPTVPEVDNACNPSKDSETPENNVESVGFVFILSFFPPPVYFPKQIDHDEHVYWSPCSYNSSPSCTRGFESTGSWAGRSIPFITR